MPVTLQIVFNLKCNVKLCFLEKCVKIFDMRFVRIYYVITANYHTLNIVLGKFKFCLDFS